MTQQEFEGWTHTTVDPEDYKIIETVYQGNSGLTKMTAAALFMECGLRPFVVLALDILRNESIQLITEKEEIDKQLKELRALMLRCAEKADAGRKEATWEN